MGHNHVMPFKTNLMVFLALVALTIFTVYTAKFWDLGSFNIILAMLIATVKVTLVLTWFMHLKGDKPLNKAIILSSFAFVALLAGVSYSDLFFR